MVAIRENSSQIWDSVEIPQICATELTGGEKSIMRWATASAALFPQRRRSLRESAGWGSLSSGEAGGRVATQRASLVSHLKNKWGMVEKEKKNVRREQRERMSAGVEREQGAACLWLKTWNTHTVFTRENSALLTQWYTRNDKQTQTVDCSQPSLGATGIFLSRLSNWHRNKNRSNWFFYLNKDLCGCAETNHNFTLSESNQGLPWRLGVMMWNTPNLDVI